MDLQPFANIGLIATGIAGVIYLAGKAWSAVKVGRRVTRAVYNLALIGDEDEWPNGSKTLPASIKNIYDHQLETHGLLEKYISAHRQDHEALEHLIH